MPRGRPAHCMSDGMVFRGLFLLLACVFFASPALAAKSTELVELEDEIETFNRYIYFPVYLSPPQRISKLRTATDLLSAVQLIDGYFAGSTLDPRINLEWIKQNVQPALKPSLLDLIPGQLIGDAIAAQERLRPAVDRLIKIKDKNKFSVRGLLPPGRVEFRGKTLLEPTHQEMDTSEKNLKDLPAVLIEIRMAALRLLQLARPTLRAELSNHYKKHAMMRRRKCDPKWENIPTRFFGCDSTFRQRFEQLGKEYDDLGPRAEPPITEPAL